MPLPFRPRFPSEIEAEAYEESILLKFPAFLFFIGLDFLQGPP
jgi:hypothetical protein